MAMRMFGLVTALAVASMVLPPPAEAKKAKGLIKAGANGKYKANLVKVVTYTAANKQLSVTSSQRKGTTIRSLTLLCLGVELVPGQYTECGGSFSALAPLQGVNQLWTLTAATVTIKSYNGKVLKAVFEGSAPGNSSTGNAELFITDGVVKAPLAAN